MTLVKPTPSEAAVNILAGASPATLTLVTSLRIRPTRVGNFGVHYTDSEHTVIMETCPFLPHSSEGNAH
jgi:hypothetical protein